MADLADHVSDLKDRLDKLLLPGPRRRVTKEIEQWAEPEHEALEGDRLLERYNAAVEERRAEALELLREKVDAGDAPQVIDLLNMQGTTDRQRILALEALEGHVRRDEVHHLAGVSVKQRHQVLPLTFDVLKATRSAEAGFALSRIFSEGDDPETRLAARAAADELLGTLPEISAVESGMAGSLGGGDLLFAALCLDPGEQARLRRDSSTEVRGLLVAAAQTMDEDLVQKGRTATGLSDYDSVIRRELHLFGLLSGVADDAGFQKRARDTLLGTDPLRVERDLAVDLPAPVISEYVGRATTPSSRRRNKGKGRARVALTLVPGLPADARESVRTSVLGCLSEDDPRLLFSAVQAAVRSYDPLTAEERESVVAAYRRLPADLRGALTPELGRLAGEIAAGPLEELVDWVKDAPAGEESLRVRTGIRRWRENVEQLSEDNAARLISGIGAVVDRFPQVDDQLLDEVAETTAMWLRSRNETARATRALLAWPTFPHFVIDRISTYAQGLTAKGVRRLVREILALEGGEELWIPLAQSDPGSDRLDRVVIPELARVVEASPREFADGSAHAEPAPARVMLRAGLIALRTLAVDLSQMDEALEERSTQALIASKKDVLEALDQAEMAARNNTDLKKQLEAIRGALELRSARTDEKPSPDVEKSRAALVGRFPQALRLGEGGGSLTAADKASGDDLRAIMVELDRRSHSRGVAVASDRGSYGRDLQEIASRYVSGGWFERELNDDDEFRRSPQLDSILAASWAASLGTGLASRLSAVLHGSEAGARQVRLLFALAQHPTEEDIKRAVAELQDDQLPTAIQLVQAAIVPAARLTAQRKNELAKEEGKAKSRVAERLKVPFEAVDSYLFSYFRLRSILADAGWGTAARALGETLDRSDLDPTRYTVRGDNDEVSAAVAFAVRSLGITVDNATVFPAVVEPVTGRLGNEEGEEATDE